MGQSFSRNAILSGFITTMLVFSGLGLAETPGKTLLVVAHPDDEYYFAATVYRMAVQLGGQVDELIITDGAGGFHYSSLAEPFYGKPLTTEAVGRKELPAIRKKEALRAGRVLGIRQHYFLNQKDLHFTTDEDDARRYGWDKALITSRIASVIRQEHYAYVFTILPRPATHGLHQAAASIAGTAIESLPSGTRPVLLGFDTDPSPFTTASRSGGDDQWTTSYAYSFDRTSSFGYRNALNYQIVVDWMIAEHKSQGLLQTMCGKDPKEYAWIDLQSAPDAEGSAASLFQALDVHAARQGDVR